MNSHKVSEAAWRRKVEIQHMVFMEKERCSHSILQSVLSKFWAMSVKLEDTVLDLQFGYNFILRLVSSTC